MKQIITGQKMGTLKGWWNTAPQSQRPIPRDVWLTAEQIAAFNVLGPGKSVNAVRQYIKRHQLSDHPEWCRKAPGHGRALEYNLLLFTPREVAIRKIGRGSKALHAPRELDIFDVAEDGELLREVRNLITMPGAIVLPFAAAGTIRARCLARFGTMIMKASNPAERIKMPSTSTFQKAVDRLIKSRPAGTRLIVRVPAKSRIVVVS